MNRTEWQTLLSILSGLGLTIVGADFDTQRVTVEVPPLPKR